DRPNHLDRAFHLAPVSDLHRSRSASLIAPPTAMGHGWSSRSDSGAHSAPTHLVDVHAVEVTLRSSPPRPHSHRLDHLLQPRRRALLSLVLSGQRWSASLPRFPRRVSSAGASLRVASLCHWPDKLRRVLRGFPNPLLRRGRSLVHHHLSAPQQARDDALLARD